MQTGNVEKPDAIELQNCKPNIHKHHRGVVYATPSPAKQKKNPLKEDIQNQRNLKPQPPYEPDKSRNIPTMLPQNNGPSVHKHHPKL